MNIGDITVRFIYWFLIFYFKNILMALFCSFNFVFKIRLGVSLMAMPVWIFSCDYNLQNKFENLIPCGLHLILLVIQAKGTYFKIVLKCICTKSLKTWISFAVCTKNCWQFYFNSLSARGTFVVLFFWPKLCLTFCLAAHVQETVQFFHNLFFIKWFFYFL